MRQSFLRRLSREVLAIPTVPENMAAPSSQMRDGSGREAPVVIGAVGGSGTRVISKIARSVGYFIGTHLNEAE
ncbi:MAG TPA: hypothetical protein VEZ90_17470, partial [Blastocatellia bacterium]|nr:hypothetical protein [Blastocatellia bacterium]